MDYIQKYREALARARELSKTITGANYEYIFPELKEKEKPNGGIVLEDFNEGNGFYKVNLAYLNKEQVEEVETMVKEWNHGLSEDEKIRKELIQNLKERFGTNGSMGGNLDMPKVLAWLEKIGKQNLVKKYGITGIGSKHAEGKLGEMIKKKIETENVDNADKIETEFHEGDWVVLKDGGNFSNGNKFAQIDSIELDEEMCYLDTGRWLYPSEIRPWTIDDAAAGDILTDENDNPFIYCGHDPDYLKYITAYCGISFGEFTVYDKPFLWSSDTVEPATQEQRDSLLQKMKESGYAWNSEKKELVPTYKCEVCSHSKKGLKKI